MVKNPRYGESLARGFVCLAWSAIAGFAAGQEPFGSVLASGDHVDLFLPGFLTPEFGLGRLSLGSEFGQVVSTRRGATLENDYEYWTRSGDLVVPFTLWERRFSLYVGQLNSLGEGSYRSGGVQAAARGTFDGSGVAVTGEASKTTLLQVGYQRQDSGITVHSNVLAGVFDIFDSDPDIDWRRTDQRFGADVEQKLGNVWKLCLAADAWSTGSEFQAAEPSTGTRLTAPAGTSGSEYRVGVSRSLWTSQNLTVLASLGDASGNGAISRETGEAVGAGTASERTRDILIQYARHFRNGGTAIWSYGNAASTAVYDGVVFNPNAAGISASPGTLVGYAGNLTGRRTEIGVAWTTPQGRRRSLELGYRQIWLQAKAEGEFAASEFVFGLEGTSGLSYPNVRLGEIHAAYSQPAGPADLRIEARQVIPFHLGSESSGSAGSSARPTSQSSGGWTLAATMSFRF